MLAWFLWECLACRALVVNFFLGQQLLLVMLSFCTMEAHQLSMQLKSIAFWKSHVVMWPLSKNICSRKFQTNKMFPNGQWRCPEIRVLLLYKKSRVLSLTMLPKAGWHASPLHSCNFERTCNFHPQQMSLENKLRWYAQQPKRFIFTNPPKGTGGLKGLKGLNHLILLILQSLWRTKRIKRIKCLVLTLGFWGLWRIKRIKRIKGIKRIKWFNPFNPFNPPKALED